MTLSDFFAWFEERRRASDFAAVRVPLAGLSRWSSDPDTGNLVHDSGAFFTIEGLEVRKNSGPVRHWSQPIIRQPEIGVLGILVKEFNGVLHCLMQAKVEPGNVNGLQLSPTVQATRSNHTRKHRGAATRYLEYFLGPRRGRVLVDVLQSEQGSWFLGKRNRHMVVEVLDDIEVHDDFCWLTLGQLYQLLWIDNVLNMDTRTVLSCVPVGPVDDATAGMASADSFRLAIHRSLDPTTPSLAGARDITSWLAEEKTRHVLVRQTIPLNQVRGWHRTSHAIVHEEGRYFSIIGLDIRASTREVACWSQPILAPVPGGLAALLVRQRDGVLHALVQARVAGGALDVVEIAPTVQVTPANVHHLPEEQWPPYLTYVQNAPPERIRYDVLLSEEGGRLYHAVVRYVVIEVPDDFPLDAPSNYTWTPLHRLVSLLQHSYYLNVEARTLVACLMALWARRTT
ncbi:MAG TPA: NDP-hexose 2,3-dehydratase family protein [Micromonospora sp.]